jgi:hypothetical protein
MQNQRPNLFDIEVQEPIFRGVFVGVFLVGIGVWGAFGALVYLSGWLAALFLFLWVPTLLVGIQNCFEGYPKYGWGLWLTLLICGLSIWSYNTFSTWRLSRHRAHQAALHGYSSYAEWDQAKQAAKKAKGEAEIAAIKAKEKAAERKAEDDYAREQEAEAREAKRQMDAHRALLKQMHWPTPRPRSQ